MLIVLYDRSFTSPSSFIKKCLLIKNQTGCRVLARNVQIGCAPLSSRWYRVEIPIEIVHRLQFLGSDLSSIQTLSKSNPYLNIFKYRTENYLFPQFRSQSKLFIFFYWRNKLFKIQEIFKLLGVQWVLDLRSPSWREVSAENWPGMIEHWIVRWL